MSSIRQAFISAAYYFSNPLDMARQVFHSLDRTKPKLTRDQQRGWSANLTFRTYNSLKNQGVLS